MFTPLDRCCWVVEKYWLLEKFHNWETFLDPTAWCWYFIEALIKSSIDKWLSLSENLLKNLYWVEIEQKFVEDFFLRIKARYDIDFPMDNFIVHDFLTWESTYKFDNIIWNPPRQNFTDLPAYIKEDYKKIFIKYGLIKNIKDVILWWSRIDIAALVTAKAIKDHCSDNWNIYLFLPLSIFLNDGAHEWFRSYEVNWSNFSVDQIYDFNNFDIFGWIWTRYWFIKFSKSKKIKFPIQYLIYNEWERDETIANPIWNNDWPLAVWESIWKVEISIPEWIKPRQWINTWWANWIFIFKKCSVYDDEHYILSNKEQNNIILPKKYIYPLIDKKNFHGEEEPQKYALILHNIKTWKPLEYEEFKWNKLLVEYLEKHKDKLLSRKWTMMKVLIEKWYWRWLIGVWSYSFKKYKVAWQAYWEKTFKAKIFDCTNWENWQANQSLQAFFGVDSREDAEDICKQLNGPLVEKYLQSMKMSGTCNWAQPWKIKKIIKYKSINKWLFENRFLHK